MKNLFLLGFILLLTGCSLQTKIEGKTAEEWKTKYEQLLNNVETEKKEDVFNKNKECLSFKNELEEEFLRQSYMEVFDSIFYNQKRNTCIYTSTAFFVDSEDALETLNGMRVGAYDFFTRELIFEMTKDETIFEFRTRIKK